MKILPFGLVKRRNLRDLLNQKGLGLTFVVKLTANILPADDKIPLRVHTLNVEPLVLPVK
jgi:hypothetical protein